ncbi:MAG: hypothetical protein WCK14_03395 [Actinomycetota bacterium]|jgi:hypothetical protein
MTKVSFLSKCSTRAASALVAVVLVGSLAGCSSSGTVVTVTHPEVPTPTVVDLGDPGTSVGDQRIWHFDGKTADGKVVRTDWIMTTTGIDVTAKDVQARMMTAVFTFDTSADQLVLQGMGLYPGKGAVLKVSSSTIRTIAGGSGKYAGATGWVESVHLADGTWKHVFHIK